MIDKMRKIIANELVSNGNALKSIVEKKEDLLKERDVLLEAQEMLDRFEDDDLLAFQALIKVAEKVKTISKLPMEKQK